jgi:hypothetical protein
MQSAATIVGLSRLSRFVASAIVDMPVQPSDTGLSPRCEICGVSTAQIGKLPRIGLRPLVYVYKCDACNQITSIEPERQDSPTISPTATPPMPKSRIKKNPHRISRREPH